MSNFKNMKIEINEQQPLDDVVVELERLGYETWGHFKEDVNVLRLNTMGRFAVMGLE